jgi:hypothetical protein
VEGRCGSLRESLKKEAVMFKKLGFAAVLAGLLLISPAAFAQRGGHAAGSRGFSGGGRSFSGPAVSGRAFAGGRGYYGGGYGYGGYRGYDRGYYAGPRFGVGLGFYGSGYAPGCGFYDRFGNWHSTPGCYASPY